MKSEKFQEVLICLNKEKVIAEKTLEALEKLK